MRTLKFYLLIGGMCLLAFMTYGQNETQEITELQFFFDTDPGFGITAGNSHTVTISPTLAADITVDIPIPESLTEGFHMLYVRARDTYDNWSIAERRSICLFDDADISLEVVAKEYFIDSDPGAGSATAISNLSTNTVTITDDNGVTVTGVDQSMIIEIPQSLDPGFHTLYVRALDEQGRWSIADRRSFYIMETPISENIVAMQYFFNHDPGAGVIGNGDIIPLPEDITISMDFIAEVPPDLECIPELYVRFQDDAGRWSLAERRTFDNPHSVPLVDFEDVRTGNTITLQSEMANSESFLWTFNDESTESTAVNPAHLYETPDVYDICLTSSNAECGSRSICKTVTVPGISHLNPSRTAPTANFIGDISGGGFVAGTTFRFIGQGLPDIVPYQTLIGGSTRARILCDLSGQTGGYRDLVVSIPNLPEDTMHAALEILSTYTLAEGQRPKVTIAGPTSLWVGAWPSEYTVAITNTTDETMFAIPVSIQVPNVDVTMLSAVEDDTTGVLSDVGIFIEDFDSTLNVVTRKIAFILIPYIAPGETKIISFTVSAPYPITSTIDVIVYSAWSTGIPIQGRTPTCDDLPACVNCAMEAAGLVEGLDCLTSAFDILCSLLDVINDPESIDYLSVLETIISAAIGCGLPADEAIELALDLLSNMQFIESLNDYLSSEDIVDLGDECNECAMDIYNRFFAATYSVDPNYKSGVGNSTPENHVNGLSPLTYQVHFENADTALAPASFVILEDVLDSTKFDLSTFSFISYGFASHHVDLQLKQTEFAHDLNLNPEKNIVVRNLGRFDPVTGALTWKMLSYYPDSLKLVDDPNLGFLNPNVTAPEGQGFVEFSILPKPTLQHNDIIHNDASITFDFNDPIITNDFINTIDKVKPQSNVLPMTLVTNDSVITIQVNLSDSGAGVSNYDLYISENDGAWKVRKHLTSEIVYFSGIHGHEYKFYSVARDKVANTEDAPINPVSNPDAVTTLDTTRTWFYLDGDQDGFGDVNTSILGYVLPAGYVSNSLDCHDGLASVNPNAIEICNLIDDDCDGETDEGVTTTFYLDADADGFGDGGFELASCSQPEGYVSNGNDCDDSASASYPGANEIFDGLDNDCDGQIDEDLSDLSIDAGSCETVHLGYEPAECTALTVLVTGGVSPYAFAWDSGSTSQTLTACPEETRTYSVTVTDSEGFSAQDVVTVHVLDVRCGNNNDKVAICHSGSDNLCIAANAVQAHLDHGDALGSCEATDPCGEQQGLIILAEDMVNSKHNNTEMMTHTNSVDDKSIVVYPNPASTFITLQLPDEKMLYEINILDYTGKVILTQLFNGGKQSLQIRDVANGAYLIEIITALERMAAPIVVIH